MMYSPFNRCFVLYNVHSQDRNLPLMGLIWMVSRRTHAYTKVKRKFSRAWFSWLWGRRDERLPRYNRWPFSLRQRQWRRYYDRVWLNLQTDTAVKLPFHISAEWAYTSPQSGHELLRERWRYKLIANKNRKKQQTDLEISRQRASAFFVLDDRTW